MFGQYKKVLAEILQPKMEGGNLPTAQLGIKWKTGVTHFFSVEKKWHSKLKSFFFRNLFLKPTSKSKLVMEPDWLVLHYKVLIWSGKHCLVTNFLSKNVFHESYTETGREDSNFCWTKMFHLCGRKIQLFCRIKVQPAIWHGNSDKGASSIDLIFCSMFRCTTQILTRCRGQCALTWSTRRGPLSMTSQISLSLSCHRYWMNSGQVWVYLVQVWM